MCFFKSKKAAEVKRDRELIEENGRAAEALIILAKDDKEIVKSLTDLKEKLKYLIPTDKAKVIQFDETIKRDMERLRSALTVSDGEFTHRIESFLTQLKLTIADRNTYL
ncbi:MAG: hypothetical protein NC131_07015 [Roseburia sp.]|nr:hypothetical protein [Roseburia sp.]